MTTGKYSGGATYDFSTAQQVEQRIKAYANVQGGESELSHNISRKFELVDNESHGRKKLGKTVDYGDHDLLLEEGERRPGPRRHQFIVTTGKKSVLQSRTERAIKTERKRPAAQRLETKRSVVADDKSQSKANKDAIDEETAKPRRVESSKMSLDKSQLSYHGYGFQDTPNKQSSFFAMKRPSIVAKDVKNKQTGDTPKSKMNVNNHKDTEDDSLLMELKIKNSNLVNYSNSQPFSPFL